MHSVDDRREFFRDQRRALARQATADKQSPRAQEVADCSCPLADQIRRPNDATATDAMWRIALSSADVQSLMAPDLVPRLPYLVALMLTAVAVWVHGQWQRATPHHTLRCLLQWGAR